MYALLFIIPFIAIYTIFVVYAERKVSAFMQDRFGPMEVGPKGLLQTIADVLKLLQKEQIVTRDADKWVFLAAPILIFASVFAGFAVMPFAPGFIGSGAAIGVFYLLAIVALDVFGILLAGWSSNNKYSVLGAMRAVSQVISYEVPMTMTVLCVIMLSQTTDLSQIGVLQGVFSPEPTYLFGISDWGVLVNEIGGIVSWNIIQCPPMIIGLVVYFIATLAESNRAPFDLPEAESELISGFQTEYGGFRWSVIMLAEYAMMLLTAMLGVTLFLGGWNTFLPNIGSVKLATWTSGTPGEWSGTLWGLFWFLGKTITWVYIQIWIRWTLPRMRVDQLMYMCWKVLTPISLILVLLAGLWRFLMN